MVKLGIIWKTLTITKNPLSVLSMKRANSRKVVTFWNGLALSLTWPQFRLIRDSYSVLTNYSINQVNDDLFKIKGQKIEVTCSSGLIPLICELVKDFEINQEGHDTFRVKNQNFQLVGSSAMLICIKELLRGEYECDCQNKVVLDIGGFEGESAAYFWSKHAKKIVIFEPVPEHIRWIEKNIELNNINSEVHQAGIGNRNEIQTILYNEADIGFGLLNKGSKSMEITVRDISEVILESGAHLAKFDCEGAEQSLTHVTDEVLRRIDYYIIEVHSPDVKDAICEKFLNSGFKLEKEKYKSRFCILNLRKIDQKLSPVYP